MSNLAATPNRQIEKNISKCIYMAMPDNYELLLPMFRHFLLVITNLTKKRQLPQ